MPALSDTVQSYVADRRAKGYAAGTIANTQRILRHLLAAVGNIR